VEHAFQVPVLCIGFRLLNTFVIVFTVYSQNVRVEPLPPQPACLNEVLVYNCQVEFPSVSITWRHTAFGTLEFIATAEEEGSMIISSDGRVVANLTMSEGTGLHRMVASTLTIQPPLDDLNGTNLNGTTLTCEGFESLSSTRSGTATVMLAGECMVEMIVALYEAHCAMFNSHTVEDIGYHSNIRTWRNCIVNAYQYCNSELSHLLHFSQCTSECCISLVPFLKCFHYFLLQ